MAKFESGDDSVVVIIGSGAGGGTLANELCQKGIKVVALPAPEGDARGAGAPQRERSAGADGSPPFGGDAMSFDTENHSGVCARPSTDSQGFVLNHSMLRVKDPAVSLDFYTRVFGMRVLRKLDFPEMKSSLDFLHRPVEGNAPPDDEGERTAWTFSQHGILELTHNWGTESDAGFKYHDGNAQPQGFGHICFSVPDLDAGGGLVRPQRDPVREAPPSRAR